MENIKILYDASNIKVVEVETSNQWGRFSGDRTVTKSFDCFYKGMKKHTFGTHQEWKAWASGALLKVSGYEKGYQNGLHESANTGLSAPLVLHPRPTINEGPPTHPWWCEGCGCWIAPEAVTFGEYHDERCGGCGGKCV